MKALTKELEFSSAAPNQPKREGCASIAKAWAAQVVRRANSSAGKRLGEQGAVPQRARKRLAGSNRQVLTEDPTGEPSEKVVDGESVICDPTRLCAFL